MGASSDKAQQNQAANQQVAQNTQTALSNLQQYNAQNPSPVNGVQGIQGPHQMTGAQGGGTFGKGDPQQSAQPHPPQIPPEILALLQKLSAGGGAPQPPPGIAGGQMPAPPLQQRPQMPQPGKQMPAPQGQVVGQAALLKPQ